MLNIDFYLPGEIIKNIKAENLTIDTKMGEIGIFPEHMKLLTVLSIGKMELEIERQLKMYAVSGGILKTQGGKVEFFSPAIEKKDNIDKKRAKEAKKRAEEYIEKAKKEENDIDLPRAEKALAKAVNRLKIASG